MIAMSEKKARQLGLISKKPAKYNNQKKVIDGIKFDSIKESEYYCQLKILQRAGEVVKIELQPKFELQPAFVSNGKKERAIIYKADFKVVYADGRTEVIDVKSSMTFKTKEYRIKRKILLYKYPDINFKEEY